MALLWVLAVAAVATPSAALREQAVREQTGHLAAQSPGHGWAGHAAAIPVEGVAKVSNVSSPFRGLVDLVPFEDSGDVGLLKMMSARNRYHGFPPYGVREWDYVCQYSHDSNHSNIKPICSDVPDGSVVQAGYVGYCQAVTRAHHRACKYLTVLREPIARVVASYSRFCLHCGDAGAECPDPLNLKCPNMSLVDYAKHFGNVYTKRWSGCTTRTCVIDRHSQAIETINGNDTLALPLETFYANPTGALSGFDRVAQWLNESSVEPFLFDPTANGSREAIRGGQDSARRILQEQLTQVHENTSMYVPTAQEVKTLENVLQYDIAIYQNISAEFHKDGYTFLAAEAPAGTTTLFAASMEGFSVGDVIEIVGGMMSEKKTIAEFGSIIVDSPLKFSYPSGSAVIKSSFDKSAAGPRQRRLDWIFCGLLLWAAVLMA